MSAKGYLIVDCMVTDPVAYEGYKALAQLAIAEHGGRYLVRGGDSEVLEGDWTPARTVVVEFPSPAAAKNFYDSPTYRAARAARAGAAEMKMLVVTGVDNPV